MNDMKTRDVLGVVGLAITLAGMGLSVYGHMAGKIEDHAERLTKLETKMDFVVRGIEKLTGGKYGDDN